MIKDSIGPLFPDRLSGTKTYVSSLLLALAAACADDFTR